MTPYLAALVGHKGRWATLAGLVPICPRGHVSRFDPKVPHFSRKFPPVAKVVWASKSMTLLMSYLSVCLVYLSDRCAVPLVCLFIIDKLTKLAVFSIN